MKHMDPLISYWIPHGSPMDPPPDPRNLGAPKGTRMARKRACQKSWQRTCMQLLLCSALILQAVTILLLQQSHAFGKAIAKPLDIAIFVDFVAASLQTSSILFPRFLPALRWSSPSQNRELW